MRKQPHFDHAETAQINDSRAVSLGMLTTATIQYTHTPLKAGIGVMTLGELIDSHCREMVESGKAISELTLTFETREQQEMLADLYR